jgi:hypothetical protein
MKTDNVLTENTQGVSVPILAYYWKYHTTLMFPSVARPLTPKEFGQLKLLRKHLGDSTRLVLDWVLNNWSRFCSQAISSAGLSSAPATPHIGFLLAHCAVAVNLMYSLAKSKDAKTEADWLSISTLDDLFDRWKKFFEQEVKEWEQLNTTSQQ